MERVLKLTLAAIIIVVLVGLVISANIWAFNPGVDFIEVWYMSTIGLIVTALVGYVLTISLAYIIDNI